MSNERQIILGKYEITKVIKKGGMSCVYLATDTRLNKLWAVKEVDKTIKNEKTKKLIESLMHEVRLMEGLNHNAIPRITDIINTPDKIYIIEDYVEGEDLYDYLKISGARSEDEVIDWMIQLCDILTYLHEEKHIIHRDIKPANIRLQPGPQNLIKILDFGIAIEMKEGSSTRNINGAGTRGYCAPEQTVLDAVIDPRVDIYAIGTTMYHLLTGQDPRNTGGKFEKLRRVTGVVSDKTEGLEYIISKCIETDPDKRYQSCEELKHDLKNVEKLSQIYRRKLKNKISWFASFSALFLVFLLTSGSFFAAYQGAKNSTQLSYAKEIYEIGTEYIDKSNIDYSQLKSDLENISENVEKSKKIGSNSSLILATYSFAMWNIDVNSQSNNSGLFDNDIEDEDYKICKNEFDKFVSYATSFSIANSDNPGLASCISEMNGFYLLFYCNNEITNADSILSQANSYIENHSDISNITLEEGYESINNYYPEFAYKDQILRYKWGVDLIPSLCELSNSKTTAGQISGAKNNSKVEYEETFDAYINVINSINDTDIDDEYKIRVNNSIAAFLEKYTEFKKIGIKREQIKNGEDRIYDVLLKSSKEILENSSDDNKEKASELVKNIENLGKRIDNAYEQSKSKNQ